MESIEKKKRGDIGWAVIAASIMILFTFGFLTALVGLDYNPHEDIALELTLRDPITLFKEHPEPLSVFWMLNAVHGLTADLIPLLDPDDATLLRGQYDRDFPRRERLPVQKKVYEALKKKSRS